MEGETKNAPTPDNNLLTVAQFSSGITFLSNHHQAEKQHAQRLAHFVIQKTAAQTAAKLDPKVLDFGEMVKECNFVLTTQIESEFVSMISC
jgi:hypothetical protein